MFGALWVSILAKRGLSAGPHESRMGVAERRQKLRSQYFFDCDCPPCEREKQRPSAGPGRGAFRCHRCRALLQVNLSLFSWLFWDISYPAERPEIFRRMPLGLGGAESHTLSSPHLDHPLQEPQGRVGIHALSPAKSRESHLN